MDVPIKISVIVPVYNVMAYLTRCVDAIRKQTYRNLEILLVDDGSTDNSGRSVRSSHWRIKGSGFSIRKTEALLQPEIWGSKKPQVILSDSWTVTII